MVSDNLPHEKAGFGHSLPFPVIAEIKNDAYIYGDCDFDLRLLNRKTITAIKKVNVATQKPGTVFAKSPLETNAGINEIAIRNGKAYILGYESGGSGYFAVYSLEPKKLIIPWMEAPSTSMMAVSKTGTWVALYGSDNFIYNGITGAKDFEIQRADFIDFNPADENKVFAIYGSIITFYKAE